MAGSTMTGYIGAQKLKEGETEKKPSIWFKEGEKTNSVIFQIGVGKQPDVQWHTCKAYGKEADKMKDLKVGQKLELTGEIKKEGDKEFFVAKEITDFKVLKDQTMTIGHIEFKTPKEKELVEITLYNNVNDQKELHKVSAFGALKDKIKEDGLAAGDKINITGDTKIETYQSAEGPKSYNKTNMFEYSIEKRAEKTQSTENKEDKAKEEKIEHKAETDKKKTNKKGMKM